MADDKFTRPYRSAEPPRRDPRFSTPSAPPPESDPLAELARLIGQSDPFAEFGSRAAAPETRHADSRYADPGAARYREPPLTAPEPHRAPLSAYETMQYQPEHDSMRGPDPHRGTAPGHFGYGGASADDADPHDAYQTDVRVADGYPRQYDAEPDRFGKNQLFAERGEHVDHGRAPSGAAYGGSYDDDQHDDYHADPAHFGLHDAAIYDDPARARRQGGLFTAVLLIGCAVVGTAAAYGYRTYSVARGVQSPPVITADTAPSKVVPAAAEAQSGKAIQERLGDQAANERIVSHQEEPMQLKDPSTPPRVVLPTPFTPAPAGAAPPATVAPSAAAAQRPASAGSNEPKKVRTVTIRPDGSDPSARPMAPALPSIAPVASRPAAPGRPAGPLSLDPQGRAEAPPAQPARTASIPPPAAAGTPTRLAPASAGAAGGYVVQLSSQRSEADAQSSFRSLQAKFPTVLGDREAIIRRADLGAKGTYFRAMVGPFASSGEAEHFCGSLKAAGGQCIIQKN